MTTAAGPSVPPILRSMTLPRLEPTARMADQVFEAIHEAIMNGNYPAGHRLRIRDLATDLGTSVMPVREAIRRLEEVGLVETKPNRGAAVRGFTREELLHIYAVRRTLEVDATAQAAGQVTDEDIAALTSAYADLERTLADRDVVGYLDADERFLAILYGASGNPVLVDMIQLLWQRCRSYKIVGASNELETGQPDLLLKYQRSLLDAATARDAAAATALSEASIDAATERIRQALPEA